MVHNTASHDTNGGVRNTRRIQIPAAFLHQQESTQNSHPPRAFHQNYNKNSPHNGAKRSRPTNHRYEESATRSNNNNNNNNNNMDIEANSLRLPSRDREMPSATTRQNPEVSDRELAIRLQQQFNNESHAAQRMSQQQTPPRRSHNNPPPAQHRVPQQQQQQQQPMDRSSSSNRSQNTNNNGSTTTTTTTKKKPDKLIIGLIITLFVIGTVALGLLQYQHGEEMNERKKQQPRIFDDYFVGKFNGTVVLKAAESLSPGEYAFSPSGQYRVGLSLEGDLVLQEVVYEDVSSSNNETVIMGNETTMTNETTSSQSDITNDTDNVFSTRSGNEEPLIVQTTTVWNAGVTGGAEVYLQTDGNLVIKTASKGKLWSSGTHKHSDATLIVDDGGRIGVRFMESLIWMQGVPQGTYRGPSSVDLTFPVRGAFYYAWYPQTWKVSSGALARFMPDLGYYVSGDPAVVDAHIDQLEYGKFDLGIISWFGPSSNLDIARITNLMDRTLELNANIKWTIYYEDEWALDPNQTQLKEDYEYIKKYFAWHPTYAHVDGKPLIFIWNEDDCEVVDRWVEASENGWYIIPKLFGGYKNCPTQPDDWHQYGPARAYTSFSGHSVSISPGFWHAGEALPRLPRLSESEWCGNVRKMVQSREPWQLVTTFNEQGEGTSIESTAAHWPSESGYGYYLDCLHLIP